MSAPSEACALSNRVEVARAWRRGLKGDGYVLRVLLDAFEKKHHASSAERNHMDFVGSHARGPRTGCARSVSIAHTLRGALTLAFRLGSEGTGADVAAIRAGARENHALTVLQTKKRRFT